MCGIVGAVGHKHCSSVLLDALKRLEYRGYDSSGIVTIHDGKVSLTRAVGKLVNLDAALVKAPLQGDIGIGHTRWATHGEVSAANAHPHVASDRVSIVHNGIIENHRVIRRRLEDKGYQFSSDTTVNWSINGGLDEGLFEIQQDGTLSFSEAPAYANPNDQNHDNIYEVVIRAADLSTGVTTDQKNQCCNHRRY